MYQVNINEAETTLAQLIERVEDGETVMIARAGKPVAMLVSLPKPSPFVFGSMEGEGWISDDFDDPLPTDILLNGKS